MLLVIPFCRKDRELAVNLLLWLREIGSYPTHELLLVRDRRAALITELPEFGKRTELLIADDTHDAWPQSANLMLQRAAKHIQYSIKAPYFFWIEADAVVLRATAFDEVQEEYEAAIRSGKRFTGDRQDARNNAVAALPGFVNHLSGISVMPGNLTEFAGEVFYAENTPWDIAAGPQIYAQAMQSELILQSWNRDGKGLSPFTSWQDFEQKVLSRRPKCAIFHADKLGSLYPLLRERRMMAQATAEMDRQAVSGQLPMTEPGISAEIPSARIAPEPKLVLTLPDINQDITLTLNPWMGQTPWQDRASSIAEIQALSARLKQFQIDMAKIRLVREELHNAGVIKLAYRFKKRKGWKRKGWKRKAKK